METTKASVMVQGAENLPCLQGAFSSLFGAGSRKRHSTLPGKKMKKRNASGDIVPGTLPVDPLRHSPPNNIQSDKTMNIVYLELHNPNNPDTYGWFDDDAGLDTSL